MGVGFTYDVATPRYYTRLSPSGVGEGFERVVTPQTPESDNLV